MIPQLCLSWFSRFESLDRVPFFLPAEKQKTKSPPPKKVGIPMVALWLRVRVRGLQEGLPDRLRHALEDVEGPSAAGPELMGVDSFSKPAIATYPALTILRLGCQTLEKYPK